MSTRLLIGPLLGLESDTLYTVCFRPDPSIPGRRADHRNDMGRRGDHGGDQRRSGVSERGPGHRHPADQALGSGPYLRTRNDISLLEGSDGKLWANSVCDADQRPEYPLA